MKIWNSKLITIIILGLIIISGIHLVNLTKYPPVSIDEPWTANYVWNFLTTGKNFDMIHAGVPGMIYEGFTTFNFIGLIPYMTTIALFGLGLFQARLASFVFGLILLVALFLVGRKSYRGFTGAVAALLLSLSMPFTLSSHWARQDIVLAAMLVISYGMALVAFDKEKWWAHFLAGFLLAVSLDVHENASLFIPGLVILYLIQYKTQILLSRGTWFTAAGGLLGIVIFVLIRIVPSPETYFALNKYLYGTLHNLPVQDLSLVSLLRSLDDEIGRYHFYENSLDFALIGASFVYLAIRRSKSDQYLLAFTASAFLCFILFQGNKYDSYAILFYPFFMLAVAETFASLIFSPQSEKFQIAFALMLLILFIFNGSIHFTRLISDNKDYNYEKVMDRIDVVVPQGARVLGSDTWWFGLTDTDFHSFKKLQYYNFYEGYSLVDGLKAIRPDVIITDDFMEISLFAITGSLENFDNEPRFSYEEFEQFLNDHGVLRLELDARGHGPIRIYEINWINNSGQ
jgi:4-amino-4-deoxy-L-arabinose transferase-like glycosyltransferase